MAVGATGFRWLLFFLAVTFVGTAQAELFKCVVDGATVFQDHACATGAQEDLCAGGSAKQHPDSCAGSLAARNQPLAGPGSSSPTGSGSRYASELGASSYGGSHSASSGGAGSVSVRGYTRKDGTYVQPHTRSAPRHR